jgi:hypothetical protein
VHQWGAAGTGVRSSTAPRPFDPAVPFDRAVLFDPAVPFDRAVLFDPAVPFAPAVTLPSMAWRGVPAPHCPFSFGAGSGRG